MTGVTFQQPALLSSPQDNLPLHPEILVISSPHGLQIQGCALAHGTLCHLELHGATTGLAWKIDHLMPSDRIIHQGQSERSLPVTSLLCFVSCKMFDTHKNHAKSEDCKPSPTGTVFTGFLFSVPFRAGQDQEWACLLTQSNWGSWGPRAGGRLLPLETVAMPTGVEQPKPVNLRWRQSRPQVH